jgi:DNA-binding NtrC family response regulator
MPERARILVADDDAPMRDSLRQALQRDGKVVDEAAGGQEALDLLARRAYDLVILDLKMPGRDGMEVLREIRAGYDHTPVVVITGYPSVDTAVEAMKQGALDFLPKPFGRDSLRIIVERALRHGRLERENRRLRSEIQHSAAPLIVGRTPEMREVFRMVERVAPTDSTVLIMGASGTGKELVARALHAGSRRADGPFVVVDCATLVGTLFENELFGHVKGSFTGAVSSTHGRFEMADGGTLFLDEVGCVEPGMQQKLLRVLEQREFTRLGSNETIRVDVRVVAATNADLAAAVRAGSFREDLYYRLSVFPIVLPPLKNRRADIPLLAEHFLRLHCESRRKEVLGFSDEAMAELTAYDWPGNVRELSNVIERAVVLAEADLILPEHLLYHRPGVRRGQARGAGPPALADVERAHIEEVLEGTGGNKREAARLLGIDRRTLYRKLRRYAAQGA